MLDCGEDCEIRFPRRFPRGLDCSYRMACSFKLGVLLGCDHDELRGELGKLDLGGPGVLGSEGWSARLPTLAFSFCPSCVWFFFIWMFLNLHNSRTLYRIFSRLRLASRQSSKGFYLGVLFEEFGPFIVWGFASGRWYTGVGQLYDHGGTSAARVFVSSSLKVKSEVFSIVASLLDRPTPLKDRIQYEMPWKESMWQLFFSVLIFSHLIPSSIQTRLGQ